MAKKQPEKPENPEKPGSKQVIILAYKADERTATEVKEWLAGLAADINAPISVTVDIALNALAKSRGYPPMPKRLVR